MAANSSRLYETLQSLRHEIFPDDDERPVELNSTRDDGDTPLHVFASRGDVESAALLVRAGADVNASGDMSQTPLQLAVRLGNVPLIDLLIEAGARTDLCSEFGKTPLDEARIVGGEVLAAVTRRSGT